jgi:hypothetical protein
MSKPVGKIKQGNPTLVSVMAYKILIYNWGKILPSVFITNCLLDVILMDFDNPLH